MTTESENRHRITEEQLREFLDGLEKAGGAIKIHSAKLHGSLRLADGGFAFRDFNSDLGIIFHVRKDGHVEFAEYENMTTAERKTVTFDQGAENPYRVDGEDMDHLVCDLVLGNQEILDQQI